MLVHKDVKSNTLSKYKCDMCKKEISRQERVKICVENDDNLHKIFDLCDNCYKILYRSVKKYSLKKGKEGKE